MTKFILGFSQEQKTCLITSSVSRRSLGQLDISQYNTQKGRKKKKSLTTVSVHFFETCSLNSSVPTVGVVTKPDFATREILFPHKSSGMFVLVVRR